MTNRGVLVTGVLVLVACSGREKLATTHQALTTCVTLQRGVSGTVADAMLSNPPAANNFGAQPIVRVGGKDEGLFRFDLGSIPATAAINSATLTLFVNGDASNTPLAIHRATSAWSETSVSFASFGQSFDPATSALINPTSANAFKSVDVKTLVQAWVGGIHPNHGLVIETSSKKKTIFVSSEATAVAQRPALEICYTTPDTDHCAANPCEHGGTCTNGTTGYSCQCPAAYTGPNCEIEIDNCSVAPCQNGGTCHSYVGGYACTCAADFVGANCETRVDDCAPNPCVNGACTDGVNAYTCTCEAGYTGTRCDVQIDDCAGSPCRNGGTCTDLLNAYACQCAPGYEGTVCESEIDHCTPNLCQNGATCVNQPTGFTCSCAPGYSGVTCGELIDNCASTPCLNGGACTNGVDAYTCACANGYTGTNCEVDTNDCLPSSCNGHGLCVDGVASFTCQCTAPYSGATCDTITPADLCAFNGQQVTQIAGAYTITNAASVEAIRCVDEIGSLTINADGSVTTIELPLLARVGALTIASTSLATVIELGALSHVTHALTVEDNPFVQRIELEALTQVEDIYVARNAALTTFAMGNVTTARNIQLRANAVLADLGAVGLGHLTSLVSDLYVSDNPLLASLGPNGLSGLVGVRTIFIERNALLTSLGPTSMQALASATGEFVIQQNPLITTVDVRNASLASLWIVGNAALATLNLGNLPATMMYVVIQNQPLLTNIGPGGLSTVQTVVSNVTLSNTRLAALDFGSLQSVGGTVVIEAQPLLTSINVGALQAVGANGAGTGYFQISSSPLLASLDLTNVTLGGLYATGNTALTTLGVGTFRNHVSYAVVQGSPNLTSLGPNELSTLVHVDLEIVLANTKLMTVNLSNLRTVGSSFQIFNNGELTTLGDLRGLVSQGEGRTGIGVEITQNPKLTAVDLGTARLAGWYIVGNALLTTFRFNSSRDRVTWARIDGNPSLTDIGPVGYSNLKYVDTYLHLVSPHLASLGATGLSNLVTVGGDLVVVAPQVSSLGPTSLANMTSIGGLLQIEQTQLPAIDVTNASVAGLWVINNQSLTALRLGVPRAQMSYVNLTNNPLLADLGTAGLSGLVTVSPGGFIIDRSSLASVGPSGLPSLASVSGGLEIQRSAFPSINLPALTAVGADFVLAASANLTAVSAPLLDRIGNYLWVDVNPVLSSLGVPALTQAANVRITSNPQLPGGCFTSLLAALAPAPLSVTISGNAQSCP